MIDFPCVTVNILTYNRKSEVLETLKKVFALNYPKDRLEVIVVVNASTDGTSDLIKKTFPDVKMIELKNNIGVPGWNYGFKEGKGDYFLVLDDDCHIEGDALKNSIQFLETNQEYGFLSFNVIDPDTGYPYTQFMPFGIFSFWGCAVLIRRDVIEKIGGFDNNIFLYAHEMEFTFRALKNGYKHKIMLSEFAYHRKNPKIAYNKGFNDKVYFAELYTYFKHLNGIYLFYFFIGALLESLYKDLKSFLKFKKTLLLNIFFTAFKLGREHKSITNKKIEKLFFHNDIRIFEKSFKYFLIQRLPRKFFNRKFLLQRFIKARISYYPDYNEDLFLNFKPVRENNV